MNPGCEHRNNPETRVLHRFVIVDCGDHHCHSVFIHRATYGKERVADECSVTPNNPLHAEPRSARFSEIIIDRRGPVNGDVMRLPSTQKGEHGDHH